MKTFFKVSLAALVGGAALALVVLGGLAYQQEHGRDTDYDEGLSKRIVLRSFRDDSFRLFDQLTGRYASGPMVAVCVPFGRDSLAAFQDRSSAYGYFNIHTGEICIPPRFKVAQAFSDGLGAVYGGDGCLHFVDASGKEVIRTRCEWDDGWEYSFKGDYCIVKDGNKFGLIDRDGEWVMSPVYDELRRAESKSERYFRTKDGLRQLVEPGGRVVIPFVFDRIEELVYLCGYTEGGEEIYFSVPDVVIYKVGIMEGLMERSTGRLLTPAIYDNIKALSSHIARFTVNDEGSVLMDVDSLPRGKGPQVAPRVIEEYLSDSKRLKHLYWQP